MNQSHSLCRTVLSACIGLVLLTSSLLGAQTNFQFILLSDTHVGSTTGEEDLRATIREINALTNMSFVILSGDVTEYGARAQLQLAKQLLGELKIPCYVVPGNHDTKWSESGATDFPKLFGDERFHFEYGGYQFIAIHQGPLMKMGDGYWSPQDVRWLKETLQAMRDPNQPVIFITHYPIDDGIANWYEVLDLLKHYNTQVVLHGHGHANRAFIFEGVPGVMGRSNLRARGPVGGFNVVTIKDGVMSFSEFNPGTGEKPAWTTVALKQHNYAADTNHYPRPDFSMNQKFANVRPRWEFNTGFTIASTPAVWENSAIIGDASGAVYSFDLKSGKVRWKIQTPGAVYSTPCVSGDRVFFAGTDGAVYCLRAATGAQVWRHATDRPIVACPWVVDGQFYVGSSEGRFRALDPETGKVRWEYEGLSGFVETRPLVADGKVIFGAWDGRLYALDAKTGLLAWRWEGDRGGALLSPAACWPVAANGKVFIVAPDRKMTAINIKNGQQIWRTGEYGVRETLGLSEDGQRVYARAMNDFIYAFSSSAETPELLWKTNAGFGYDINSAMMVEKGGTVFYGTKNGVILALDGRTGTIKWEHRIGSGVVNTLVALSPREILATDFGGLVTVLSVKP